MSCVGDKGNVELWDVKTGKQIGSIGEKTDVRSKTISYVAVMPDSERIVTGTWGGVIKLWDVETKTGRTRRSEQNIGFRSIRRRRAHKEYESESGRRPGRFRGA